MVEGREFHSYCGGEETGSKCFLRDIYKSTFHLVYYASLLMGCVNVSSCLLSVSQYFKKLPTNKSNMNIKKLFFTLQ